MIERFFRKQQMQARYKNKLEPRVSESASAERKSPHSDLDPVSVSG